MKKAILAIILFLLFLVPALSGASYLIRLKNGRQWVTPMYWVEGKLVFFYMAGGTAGIERTEIDRIEKYETDSDMKTESENRGKNGLPHLSSITEKSPESKKRTADVKQKPSVSNPTETGGKAATKKDPTVMQELNRLEKKYKARKGMSLDELKDLKNELTALRDKIVSSHPEEDLSEEVNKIADMRFFTNDMIIIKSRSR